MILQGEKNQNQNLKETKQQPKSHKTSHLNQGGRKKMFICEVET